MTPQTNVASANIPATLQGDREIFSSRLIHAPRARVFAAWTDPAQLAKWWGPNGFTTTTHVFDFRPEGTWEFTMHGPDGTEFPNKIHYLEIVPPERLVYKHGGEAGFEPVNFHVTVLFKEADASEVRVSVRTSARADAVAITTAFGGGGHARAAGCTVAAPLPDAVERVLDECERELDRADARGR